MDFEGLNVQPHECSGQDCPTCYYFTISRMDIVNKQWHDLFQIQQNMMIGSKDEFLNFLGL